MPLHTIVNSLELLRSTPNSATPSTTHSVTLQRLLGVWRGQPFLVGLDGSARVVVCLQTGCQERDVLTAFLLACHIHHSLHSHNTSSSPKTPTTPTLQYLQDSYSYLIDTAAADSLSWWTHRGRRALFSGPDPLEGGGWSVRDVWANLKPHTWRYDPHEKTKEM